MIRTVLVRLICVAFLLPAWSMSRSGGVAAQTGLSPAPSSLQLYVRLESWDRQLQPLDAATLKSVASPSTINVGSPSGYQPSLILTSADGGTLVAVSERPMDAGQTEAQYIKDITVRVIDARTGARQAQYHPAVPLWISGISRDGTQLFGWRVSTAAAQRPEWDVLDTASGSVVSRLQLPSGCCQQMLYDAAAHRLYAMELPASGPSSGAATGEPATPFLTAYDLSSGREVSQLRLDGIQAGSFTEAGTGNSAPVFKIWTPGLALSPDGHQVAVLDGQSDRLELVDTQRMAVARAMQLTQPQSLLQRLGDLLGLTPATAAAKEWLGVELGMQYAPDGRHLYVTGREGTVGSDGTWTVKGLGLRMIDAATGQIVASGLTNRWVTQVVPSPDGSALYADAEPAMGDEPITLDRLDPATLEVTAERSFYDAPEIYFLPPFSLGAAGCRPASPSDLSGGNGLPEVRGSTKKGSLWALVFGSLPIHAGSDVKIVWRMTGAGPLRLSATNGSGQTIKPDWGPEAHTGSSWNRPGNEWGAGFTFPSAGCWQVHAARSNTSGNVWFEVAPSATAAPGTQTSAWLQGWPMEGHDPQRTNRSPDTGPLHPHLLFTHQGFYATLVGPDGTIYGWDTSIQGIAALDAQGRKRWAISGCCGEGTPVLAPDGMLLDTGAITQDQTPGGNGTVAIAVRPDGSVAWRIDPFGLPKGAISLMTEDNLFYAPVVGPHNGTGSEPYIGLDIVSPQGQVLHHVAQTLSTPALGRDGTIYDGGPLRAIDAEGKVIWQHNVGAAAGPLVGRNGAIYVGLGSILAAYHSFGTLRWKLRWPDDALALAERADGVLLVAGNKWLGAVSPGGKRLWRLRIGKTTGPYNRPSLVVDAASTAYVGTSDGKVRIISRNGALVSTLSVGPPDTREVASVAASILGPGSRLIVNGTDGVLRVYAPSQAFSSYRE